MQPFHPVSFRVPFWEKAVAMASAMALSATTKDEEKRLKMLKFSRRGKKSSITKRVDELERLVEENGSRRRINFLMDALLKVFKEITEVCLEIAVLSDEVDNKNDLEMYKAKIDSCVALKYIQKV